MKFFLKFLLFFLLCFFIFPKFIFASQEFYVNYEVNYEVDQNGHLNITQGISLTNKLSNIYATSYYLKIEKTKIENIKVKSDSVPLNFSVENKDEETIIKIDFAEPVVGKDKSLKFTISYDALDIFRQNGQVWEIKVPKLANPQEIDEYNLKISIPLSFGNPAYISPSPLNQEKKEGKYIFSFNKNQVSQSGIIAAFGQFQLFEFSLQYNLKNDEKEKILRKIALPPDTAYQKLNYWSINPLPEDVEVDKDGNWLAIFELEPKEEIEVKVLGQVKIFANPQKTSKESDEYLASLLEERKYWEISDSKIQDLAQKLKTPKSIYDYVINTLDYDFSRARTGAERFGAKKALENKEKAICTEYTDLFIALARAAGIPAREINGFAYSTNSFLKPLSFSQDILHSWPEYFDKEKNTWIQIDPTWQDTTGGIDYFHKFDLDHFAFVIHGQKSEFPLPAGAYKKNNFNQKNINVSLGKLRENKEEKPEIKFLVPDKIYGGKETKGKIIIERKEGEAIYYPKIEIKGEEIEVNILSNLDVGVLPPFSKREILIKIKPKSFFRQGQTEIAFIFNDQETRYNLKIISLFLSLILPIFGGTLGAIIFFLIARKIRSLYFQRREWKNCLYREGKEPSPEN